MLALSESERCVSDLAHFMSMSEPAVSHHLRILRHLRLVRFRKAGKMTFYRLDDDHVSGIILQATDHIKER